MAPGLLSPESIDTPPSPTEVSEPSDQYQSSATSETSQDHSIPPSRQPTCEDPSVIVGMACKLPGANSISELWENLERRKDLQRKMPANRFNVDTFYHPQGSNKGTTNARYGYFLDDIDQFDASFFNISGKEAEAMDPQQRLLLEVVYEALENAGITLDEISGSSTAVYCGSFTNDYHSMTTKDLMTYPKYTVTGTGNSILSNRISFCYNLHGPSMTIDTACSSSLICFHLGNKSIQSGESDMSIVVGSALHFDPNVYIYMTDFGMLSTDGRCRTFDQDGSGYVRGEGICAAVLKRRSAAEAAGDHIHAVIRNTGANHDGLKDGITVPHSPSQADLLRRTYKEAGVSPHDTEYFEAHGTGTAAGDPREAKAIGTFFGPQRRSPLYVGSVKSCLGHLEGASGLAGIFKAVVSVENGTILPNMHFHKPNPQIDFADLKIKVPTETIKWEGKGGIRRASVNSFGYGGSNAHVILENYQPLSNLLRHVQELAPPSTQKRPYLVPLTSHSDKASKKLVAKLESYLDKHPETCLADFAHSMSSRRTMHAQRSFAIGHDVSSIIQDMMTPKPAAAWTRRADIKPRIGFVFTGQGAQWYAMGRQLIEESSFFLQTLEKCDQVLQSLPDRPEWSCVSELLKSKGDTQLSQSRYSQPVCTALQLAIVDLLRTWRVEPSAVMGHSSGEIASAYAAGILSFESAMICAYYRGLHMSAGVQSPDSIKGAMMAVGMTESEGRRYLQEYPGQLSLAAINSPSSLTISGDEVAIDSLKMSLDEKKVFARKLKVEQAFHSHHMVPLAPAFKQALSDTATFQSGKAACRMFSSVTARDSDARDMDAEYWAANMTGVVRFSDALTGMLLGHDEELQVDILVEIGPHPALKGPAKQTLKMLKLDIPYLGSLARDMPAYDSLLTLAGQLFAHGYPVDLDAVNSEHIRKADQIRTINLGQRLSNLPNYAWDHNRYWAETRFIKEHRQRQHRHSILGTPVPGMDEDHPRWRNYLRQSEISWLAGHVIDGTVIFPAAGYLCMAIESIATRVTKFKEIKLQDIMFKAALPIPELDEGVEVMLSLSPVIASSRRSLRNKYRFEVCSFESAGRTIEHCHGTISAISGDPGPVSTLSLHNSMEELQQRTNRTHANAKYYNKLQRLGLQYGDTFRLLSGDIHSGLGISYAPLSFDPTTTKSIPEDACAVHPSLLDASLHVIFAALESSLPKPLDEAFVPTFIREMKVSGLLGQQKFDTDLKDYWVRSELLKGSTTSRVATSDISIQFESSNDVAISMKHFEMTALGNGSADSKRNLFFRTKWMPAFEYLDISDSPPVSTLAQLVECFTHQFPDTNILHITSGPDATRELLAPLGSRNGHGRTFGAMTVVPTNGSDASPYDTMQKDFSDRVNIRSTAEGSYDLVVVNENHTINDLSGLVASSGYLIAGHDLTVDTTLFAVAFKIEAYTVWRRDQSNSDLMQPLILMTGSSPSQQTLELISELRGTYPGTLKTQTFKDILESDSPSGNIISTVSLDEDLFHVDAKEDNFNAMKKLVDSSEKSIVWLTQGATQETSNPAQAMLVGLARSIRSEHEGLQFIHLDLDANSSSATATRNVIRALAENLSEDELSERDGCLLIPRIIVDEGLNAKLPTEGNRLPLLEPFKQARNIALRAGTPGNMDSLRFEDDHNMSSGLAPDEVEVKIEAAAVESRDVAATLGTHDSQHLGDVCTGIVIKTGSDVSEIDLKPGDSVIAWRPGKGSHRSLIRNPAICTLKIDKDACDSLAAAAIMMDLTTAFHSILNVARLQKGEYCLISAAHTPIGQIAIQLAQNAGSHVIAGVDSSERGQFISDRYDLPSNMILNYEDDSFPEKILLCTEGHGCDVVFSSLSGQSRLVTWACMAPFGRFVDIGLSDIQENARLDMEPFKRNVSYAAVDMVAIFDLNPALGGAILRESWDLLKESKVQQPGPIERFSYSDVHAAFKQAQHDNFQGKVVLVANEEDLVPVLPQTFLDHDLFSPSKTYLLVGGLGGIGRALAEWMVRRGARNITFMSRSGIDRASAKATVEWLSTRNVNVNVFKGDVTNFSAVQECVQGLAGNLGGVFQAAMVLADVPFSDMTFAQWETCVNPKLYGTQNLHEATKSEELDFFVCFSSISAIWGSKGQSNYCAANSYLDALMRHRRELGLPGTTMNVGVVGGVGVAEEDESMMRYLVDRLGYDVVEEHELFYQIEQAILEGRDKISNDGIDSHQIITGIKLSRKDLYWATKPLFRNLYENLDLETESSSSAGSQDISIAIRETTIPEERLPILAKGFTQKMAAVLAVAEDTIQLSNPLSMYGLDSIVAVEFRKWFAQKAKAEVPLFDIMSSPSIEAMLVKANGLIAAASATSEVDQKGPADSSNEKDSAKQDTDTAVIIPEKPAEIPMSSFQNRIWFLHNLLADSSSLNFSVACHLAGTPSADSLAQALRELCNRNEALRTAYAEGLEYSEQVVLSSPKIKMSIEDFSQAADAKAALDGFIRMVRSVPMDLENGEVMRATLVKLGESEHVLSLVFHHIAVDNGSSKSFFTQLIALYDAYRLKSNLAAIHQPLLTYSDFTVWHQEELQSISTKEHLQWWKENMKGTIGVSKLLPFAKIAARPATSSRDRRILRQTLGTKLLSRLRRVSSRMEATPFHFLLAAFRGFIHRYTREDDLTILVFNGNRPHPTFEELIGMFVNITPLRFQNACDSSFENLLTEAKSIALEGISHGQVPFESIVDATGIKKTASCFPVGQIAINYQMHGKAPEYKATDFTLHDVVIEDIPTACEMSLEATENPATGLELRFEYDSFLYGGSNMDRFFENFITFMTSAISDFRQPVEEIDMVGPLELKHLRSQWSLPVSANDWGHQSVMARVAEITSQDSNAVAIEASNGVVTKYGELLSQAGRIAQSLKEYAHQGEVVAILAEPSAEAIAAMMGATIIGCGYLALDPASPEARLSYMLQDSRAPTILAVQDQLEFGSKLVGSLEKKPTILSISSASSNKTVAAQTRPRPNDPFYAVYTSGSTGKPKGVILTHANTQSMLSNHNKLHGFGPNDKILFLSSMAWDLSVGQIWGCLTSGARMALVTAPHRKDPAELGRFMKEARITASYFTPSQMALLLEHNPDDLKQCSAYRKALLAGEPIPQDLVKKFYDLGTPADLYNQYGPSESTVQTTSYKIPRDVGDSTTNVPIGQALANVSHYILDARLRPVPDYVVGELCIGGAQVGKGYIGCPEATDKVFLQDPFASDSFRREEWTRLYRTGDNACYLGNGCLEYKGRISGDKQVKLRGYRIELSEIENEIRAAHDDLGFKLGCITVVARNIKGPESSNVDERQVVAFLTPKEDDQSSEKIRATKIHETISKHLNEYMLPSGYQFLESPPLLPSGKTDIRGLKEMDLDLTNPSSTASIEPIAHRADAHTVDAIIQDIRLVLKLPESRVIEPTDSFFDLGGTSVLLLRLQSRIKRGLGITLALTDMFAQSTPVGLASLLPGNTPNAVPNNPTSNNPGIDWDKELALIENGPELTVKSSLSPLSPDKTENILLTGDASMNTAFMLLEILNQYPLATVHVLPSKSITWTGLIHAMGYWRLSSPEILEERVRITPGNLMSPNLGLSKEDFGNLSSIIDSIYHLGGHVSLLKSYTDLRQPNVLAVLDLIRLAAGGKRPSTFNYLSTWSVAHLQTSGQIIRIESAPSHFRPTTTEDQGYFKTRWLAEMLLHAAGARGLPVNIIRTSALSAPPRSGIPTPRDNFTINLFAAMIRDGVVPDFGKQPPFAVDIVPIDYACQAFVRLASAHSKPGAETFHVANPAPLVLTDLAGVMDAVRADGKQGSVVAYQEWVERMEGRAQSEAERIDWQVIKDYFGAGHVMFSLDDRRTRAKLAELEKDGQTVKCPPIDRDYLAALLI